MPNYMANFYSDAGRSLMDYGLRQYERDREARDNQGVMMDVMRQTQGVGASEQGPAFLGALMRARPELAGKFGGQYAQLLQEQSAAAEKRRQQQQYEVDMANTLAQYQALPPDQQPQFLAVAAARMGPEFAQQLFNYSGEQFRQQGTATQQRTTGEQQSQAQQASRELEDLKFRNDQTLQNQRIAAATAAAAAAARAGGGGGAGGPGLPFSVKPNQQVDIDPATGQPRVSYPVGTPEWQQARSTVEATDRAGKRIAELRKLFTDYGTESLPTDAGAKMSNIWGDIVADIARSRGLGVLQSGELEMVKKQLPNPAERGIAGWFGIGGGVLGALDQLEQEVKRNKERDARMFGHYPGMSLPADLPPGFRDYPSRRGPARMGSAPNPAARVGF